MTEGTESDVRHPLSTLLVGMQQLVRKQAGEAGGEAAAAGAPWPEDYAWIGKLLDAATEEYLQLSELRKSLEEPLCSAIESSVGLWESLTGERKPPLARFLSATYKAWVEGAEPPRVTKAMWESAFEEYVGHLHLSTPRETIGIRRRYYKVEQLNGSDHEPDVDDRTECSREEANVVGSLCQDGMHRPVIDVDHDCQLVPSSTPGHFHLYLDVPMTWEKYEKLLGALVDAGVVSHFYAKAASVRQQSFVRVPWVKKPPKPEQAQKEEAF